MKRLIFVTNKEGGSPKPIWIYTAISSEELIKLFFSLDLKIIVIFWSGVIYDGFLGSRKLFPDGIRGDKDGFEYYLSLILAYHQQLRIDIKFQCEGEAK